MKIRSVFFFALLASALTACSSDDNAIPKDILDRQKFTALMIDVQLAEGIKTQYAHSRNKDGSLSRELYDEIFERHEIKEEDFRKTYGFYQSRPELMEGVFEQVLDSLSKLEAEIKKEYSTSHQNKRDSSRTGKAKEPSYKEALVKQMQLGDTLNPAKMVPQGKEEPKKDQSKKDLK